MSASLPPLAVVLEDLANPSSQVALDMLGVLAARDLTGYAPHERAELCGALLDCACFRADVGDGDGESVGALGWSTLADVLDKVLIWLPSGPGEVQLPARPADLPFDVEVRWRMLALRVEPLDRLGPLDDPRTLEAIARIELAKVLRPMTLLAGLAALEPLPIPLLSNKLTMAVSSACVPSDALADPWVCQVERVRQSTHLLRRHIKSGDGASALAAIEVLCLLDDADAVLLASRDPEQTEQGHLLLLKHAGHLLPDEVLASVLRDAIEDPWRYGGAVIACLDRMHARGRFLSPDKAADLLDLYDRVHGFSARQAGRHLYVIRDEVFHLFEQLPASDPRWPRFLSLLPYLTKSHRDALLERLLLASSKLTTTALFIDVCESIAATADHETSLEPLLLDHLAVHPESVLRALEVCGSQRTADVLGALMLDQDTPRWLRHCSERALALVWHLDKEHAWRTQLLMRLSPERLPSRIQTDLDASISPEALSLLLLLPRATEHPEAVLKKLCRRGGSDALDAIDALLTRVLHAQVTEPQAFDPEKPWAARAEAVLPEAVEEALGVYGERLFSRGSLATSGLARAKNAREASEVMRAHLLGRQLERARDHRVLRIVLDALARVGMIEDRQQVIALLRHDEPDVRKKALYALSTIDPDPGLIARFVALAGEGDIQTVRQAIDGLGRFADAAATPALLQGLQHPNMNIKLSAAKALATAGDARAIDPLLRWLERHDHERFRRLLLNALGHVLGDSLRAVLMTRLEGTLVERHIRFLAAAIDGLSLEALRARRTVGGAAAGFIFEAVDRGDCHLKDVTRQEVQAWLGYVARRWFHDGERLYLDGRVPWDLALLEDILARETMEGIEDAWIDRNASLLLDSLSSFDKVASERLISLLGRVSDFGALVPDDVLERGCHALFQDVIQASDARARSARFDVLSACVRALPLSRRQAFSDHVRGWSSFSGGDGLERMRLLDAMGTLFAGQEDDLRMILADCATSTSRDSARVRALRELFPDRKRATDAKHRAALDAWRDVGFPEEERGALVDRMGRGRVLTYALEVLEVDDALQQDVLEHILALAPFGANSRDHYGRAHSHDTSGRWRSDRAWRAGKLDTMANHEDVEVRRASALALLREGATRDELELISRAFLGGCLGDESFGKSDMQRFASALSRANRSVFARPPEDQQLDRWLDLLEASPVALVARCTSQLVAIWKHQPTSRASRAQWLLARVDGDALFATVADLVEQGDFGAVGLLTGSISDDTHLQKLIALLEQAGERRLADRLRGQRREGVLIDPAARASRQHALERLLVPPTPLPAQQRAGERGVEDMLESLQSEDRFEVRAALKRCARFGDAEEIERAVVQLALDHEDLSLRSAAHRTLRQIASRETYLEVTRHLLHDPRRDVVRQAIRILSYGQMADEVEAFVALMFGSDSMLAKAARDGLMVLGRAALPELYRATGRARPDRRARIEEVIAAIVARRDE